MKCLPGRNDPVASRALALREEIRGELRAKYPTLMRRPEPPLVFDQTAIVLGRARNGSPFLLPERARLEHCLAIGASGSGKSKCLELCIRQDIAAGRGVLVVDPHGEHPGSLYRSVLSWMKARGYLERRTVHIFDPSSPTHTIGFNPLHRPDPETDLSVIAGVTLEAFSRAWGGEDTARKPTIERVLTATFAALSELGLTLVEAPMLLDRKDEHGLRAHAIETVTDRYTRDELRRLHELSHDERRRQDFDMEVVGPINRLARFLRPAAIRTMVGQTGPGLDMREALDNGHIILCNLSGSGRVYEQDADLLGRLITRFVFFHAKRRRNPERPFFVYMDECHRYLSGDLENILAESRKYGLGAILATQWLEQMRKESDNMLAAVLNATNVKLVFRAKDPKEAEQLAEMVIPFDLEMPVGALVKPAVIGHRRTRLSNESVSEQRATTHSQSESVGESESYTESYGSSRANTDTESIGESESDSESSSDATSMSSAFGTDSGSTETRDLDPNFGLLGPQNVLGMSRGTSAGSNRSTSAGRTTSRGRSVSSGRSSGSSRSISESETWGESHSRSTQRSTTVGVSETRGEGRSRGSSEALEPILSNLPSAVHSRDNVRYMAAQTVRNLRTGRALVNYVGTTGMVAALLHVPLVSEHCLPAADFATLREYAMSRSSCALSLPQATARIAQREQVLLEMKAQPEIPEPATFRTKAPPLAPEQVRTPPAASGRRRSRRVTKPKTVE